MPIDKEIKIKKSSYQSTHLTRLSLSSTPAMLPWGCTTLMLPWECTTLPTKFLLLADSKMIWTLRCGSRDLVN